MVTKNRKAGSIAARVILIIGLVLVIGAVISVITIRKQYKTAQETNTNIKESFTGKSIEVNGQTDKMSNQATEEKRWLDDFSVDFDGLNAINEEVCGWIHFPGNERIDYPILYSGDDDFYLHKDIYKKYAVSGCIFMEGANHPDFEDSHTIIYGHNMKNLTMFGSLRNYRNDEQYYKEHSYFVIYTKEKAYCYKIFSYGDIAVDNPIYRVVYEPGENMQSLIDEMLAHASYQTNIVPNAYTQIMTLSTCSTSGKRFVIHAVRVDECEL